MRYTVAGNYTKTTSEARVHQLFSSHNLPLMQVSLDKSVYYQTPYVFIHRLSLDFLTPRNYELKHSVSIGHKLKLLLKFQMITKQEGFILRALRPLLKGHYLCAHYMATKMEDRRDIAYNVRGNSDILTREHLLH